MTWFAWRERRTNGHNLLAAHRGPPLVAVGNGVCPNQSEQWLKCAGCY